MQNKLNLLLTRLPSGCPVLSEDLAAMGISADLAVHYVRAGWLQRLARGVFLRPGEPLALYPALKLLERKVPGFHVGGKTALDWYGIRQYVSLGERLTCLGWQAAELPEWFTRVFPAEYHRKRLFEEQPESLIHCAPFENAAEAPRTSEPERALLELLSEVGVRQPLSEVRELMEGTYSLRVSVLRSLLLRCTSVKTVRLCLQLGQDLSLPWINELDPEELPTGSDRAWVARYRDGALVLKP